MSVTSDKCPRPLHDASVAWFPEEQCVSLPHGQQSQQQVHGTNTPSILRLVLAPRKLRSVAWPPYRRSVVRFLAEGTEESDGGPRECSDEVRRNPQAGKLGIGPFEGIGPDLVDSVRGTRRMTVRT
jgi:hypothetical protein